jgi:glucose-1-phosphate cytidylyltransferase
MTTLKTIILCGGQGTRIRDVADDIPKPLIRVGDKPILWHIMKHYAHYNMKDFVLCLGYKGWLIKEFFLNYHQYVTDFTVHMGREIAYHNQPTERDWSVTMAETGIQTMTGARIARVQKYVADADLVCVTYGDGLSDVDLGKLIAFHKAHGRVGTVTGVRPAGRFGVLEVTQEGSTPMISKFQEKPQALDGLINGGFFVFDQRLFNYVEDDADLIFEREPLKRMAEDGELVVFEHDGFWQPMDTYREWVLLNRLWDEGRAPWLLES